jgi:hypothetical protein
MNRPDEAHDTDPSPAPDGNGKGVRDSQRFPCTIHAAQLVETREFLGEMRTALAAISGQLGDEIATRKKWAGEVEFALLEQANAIRQLTSVIGEPPDQTTGKAGTGMRGQWVSAINAVIKSSARREMPSITAEESDEVTGVMDRETLVIRARKAERDRHVMLVRAVVAGVLAIIGALVTAAVTLIPMLR